MLPYISLATDAVASFAVIISVFFLLKELKLTRDSIKHSDFMNSINRSAENMLRITENDSLLRTIEKISVYRGQKSRNRADLARIIRNLPLREKHRYFHFQRNACLNCEVFLESASAGFIDAENFSMAFGWSAVDFEIWEELDLEIGSRTREHFRKPALVGETVFREEDEEAA